MPAWPAGDIEVDDSDDDAKEHPEISSCDDDDTDAGDSEQPDDEADDNENEGD